MGIFYRRPLCLFCCLFLLGAIAAWFLPSKLLLWMMAALFLMILALFLCVRIARQQKLRFLTLMLCAISLFGAILHSYVTVDLAQTRAWQYLGRREVELTVTEAVLKSEYASVYEAVLTSVDGKESHCTVTLQYDFPFDLSAGDRVYATAEITRTVEDASSLVRNSDGRLLYVNLDEEDFAFVRRAEAADPSAVFQTRSGLRILSLQIRSVLQGRLQSLLGEEIGALADAFLLGGSSSHLSDSLIRDFRRSGVSHMMAVSGMHVVILIGSLELLLRKLLVPKRVRCVLLSILALFFLFLTGFSLSACRSVLMLFAVYLHFLLGRENDTLTALFVSIVLILLIFPYSVADLGMWMSFLATMGLVTVYPLCEGKIPYTKNPLLKFLRSILCLVIMTIVSNLFLLPIQWAFFGELSWIALLANIILNPFSYVFLIGVPLVLLCASVPFLGALLRLGLLWVGRLMIDLVNLFSSVPSATISLRYEFCRVLIPLFAVASCVLLIVRLRRKVWVALPSVATAIAFVVCLIVVRLQNPDPIITYVNDGVKNEYFCIKEDATLVLCDLSDGGRSAYKQMHALYEHSYATEIEALILTHYHQGHRTTLTLLASKHLLREVCLPMPWDAKSLEYARELERIAQKNGVRVSFYEGESVRALSDSSFVRIDFLEPSAPESTQEPTLALAFSGNRQIVSYFSANAKLISDWLAKSETVLIGTHGEIPKKASPISLTEGSAPKQLIYTSCDIPIHTGLSPESDFVYRPKEGQAEYSLTFVLP